MEGRLNKKKGAEAPGEKITLPVYIAPVFRPCLAKTRYAFN
jgi:hypothetical protein